MKIPEQLLLTVTLGCNSKCAHCCFACEPGKANLVLTEEDMLGYIRQAGEHGIRNVVFSGGEPTLDFDSIIQPILLARKLGMYIDIRTNAYWAREYNKAFEILNYLKDIGLQRLGLSYDRFHSEWIPPECIFNALDVSKKLGLEVFLDWIGSETWEQVVSYLKIDSPTLRTVGTLLKVGRGTNLDGRYSSCIPIEALETDSRYSIHCNLEATPILTVFPERYASYHPCCWVNPALIRKVEGNEWMEPLRREMESSPMVNSLGREGLGGLIRRGREEYPELLKPIYGHQCEVCYDLLGTLHKDEIGELPWFIEDFKGVGVEV